MKEEIQKYLQYKQKMLNHELAEYLMNEEDLYDKSTDEPLEITVDEYSALYDILKDDIKAKNTAFEKNQLQSISNSLLKINSNLSIIKGIMIFTLIVSVLAGVIASCSILS